MASDQTSKCNKNSTLKVKSISEPCPHCTSRNTIKRAKRETQNRGTIQRYFCKDCRKRFTKHDPFFRMRNTPQKITLCMDLFFRGISTRKVQEHLQAFYPHNSDNSTIYRWIIKYSDYISRFTDTLKPTLGAEVQVDEIEFHRRKNPRAHEGIAQNWLIDSIDPKTRFAVASNYVESRNTEEIKSIMQSIKKKAENVKIITTDGFMAYENVVKKTFGYSNKLKKYKIVHNQVIASQGEGFNYPIERLHNNIRARTKTMRGFHGSVESARAILKGIEIYYNYITKHQGINKTPSEEAKIKLNLSCNRWFSLIKLAHR